MKMVYVSLISFIDLCIQKIRNVISILKFCAQELQGIREIRHIKALWPGKIQFSQPL